MTSKKFKVVVTTTYFIDEDGNAENEDEAIIIADQMLRDDIDSINRSMARIDDLFEFKVEEEK